MMKFKLNIRKDVQSETIPIDKSLKPKLVHAMVVNGIDANGDFVIKK